MEDSISTLPFSLLAIALPLYGLFEVSVVVSTVVYRRRQKREAARAQEAGATA